MAKQKAKQKAKKYTPTVTRGEAFAFARLCVTAGSLAEVVAAAREWAGRLPAGDWQKYLIRFADCLDSGRLPHSIFAMAGNTKLPFASFSTLPVVTCPGAGSCAGIVSEGGEANLDDAHCYSLRAWRYAAAFLRQCQNTLLLRFNRRAIIEAFRELAADSTLRLYVDGDFDSPETFAFWMNLLRQRPDILAYGYSKSWRIVEALADRVPENYVLNLSSGGIHDDDDAFRERLRELPFVRGDFLALPIAGEFARGFKRYSDPAYHRAVREAAERAGIGKVFSCPGQCGSCIGAGHACGVTMPAESNGGRRFVMPLPIAIGIH